MKAPSTKVRFSEAQKLLDYGFNNFSFKQFGKKGDIVKSINVTKGVSSSVDAVLEKDAGTLLEKGKDKDLKQEIVIEDSISAPISEGQKLGEVNFNLNGENLATVNLVAKSSVEKINIFTMTKRITYKWIDLLR